MRQIHILVKVFLLLSFLGGCSTTDDKPLKNTEEVGSTELWSIKMARSVVANNDSLMWYNGHLNKPKWKYDLGFLGQAIDKLGSHDSIFNQYAQDYIDNFIQEDGTIRKYKLEDYNLDNINPGKHIITLYKRTGEEKYKLALDQLYEQLEGQPKTNAGGFWHKKRYPSQMWLDGIYMSSPFLAQYAREFNKPELFDLVAHQITLIYEKTWDQETGLLFHAWDESRQQRWSDPKTGQSKHFWSRAMGWYMMAIVDVLDYFPENHPKRAQLIEILNKVSEALLTVQDKKTGLWHQVLDKGGHEGNYIEGSGSAMYIYAFAKGANHGYLPHDYLKIANKSFEALVQELIVEDQNGNITFTNICGGCGLGGKPYREGDYAYYINEKRVDNDQKGVAPFILAALELNK